jgi:hypothetical protein
MPFRVVFTMEHLMKTIAIGMLGILLASTTATAQTAAERDRILRDFQRHVAAYSAEHHCLDLFPEALNASTPAPRIFTPPVAVVFRQLIAAAIHSGDSATAMRGVNTPRHHVSVLQPFPATELNAFPQVLTDALPPLPDRLEYRLIDNDLVLRDAEADVIVAVLRDALATATTVRD